MLYEASFHKDINWQRLGDNFRQYRRQAGLSAQQVAGQLDVCIIVKTLPVPVRCTARQLQRHAGRSVSSGEKDGQRINRQRQTPSFSR